MNTFSILNTKTAKCGLGLTLVAALVACGGGSDTVVPVTVPVGAANVTVGASNATPEQKTATASVLAAAASKTAPVTFPTGFSGTDANGAAVVLPAEPTAVAFTAGTTDTTKPTFDISSASGSASGDTTLGSCTMTVRRTTYPLDHPLGMVGRTLRISLCTVTLPTFNLPADGIQTIRPINFNFNGMIASNQVQLSFNPGGNLNIGGTPIPNTIVPVRNTSGTSN